MGSKNLKAVAIRGKAAVAVADPEAVKGLGKWMAQHWKEDSWSLGLHDTGTAGGVEEAPAHDGEVGADLAFERRRGFWAFGTVEPEAGRLRVFEGVFIWAHVGSAWIEPLRSTPCDAIEDNAIRL